MTVPSKCGTCSTCKQVTCAVSSEHEYMTHMYMSGMFFGLRVHCVHILKRGRETHRLVKPRLESAFCANFGERERDTQTRDNRRETEGLTF